jgi:glycolate oxidase iron-sulfur subunit
MSAPDESTRAPAESTRADLAGPDRPTILNCVHCGLCLSACPTYRETKLETESPRGRIYLMRALQEGRLEPSREVSRHFDLCLNCRACETACPAGVHYGLLLETTRARLAIELPPTLGERVRDIALEHVFPFPGRMALVLGAMRLSARLGLLRLARGPLGRLLPRFARVGAELWPESTAGERARAVPPGTYPPYEGEAAKARVAWFRTCLMPGTFPATDRAAVHLLREAGAMVVVPAGQGCCGSLHAHAGRRQTARELAVANLAWFEQEKFDFVATDVAGCGATLREYGELFDAGGVHDPALAARARAFAGRVRDITEVLEELGLPPARAEVRAKIAVHDPCHLAHAQRVRRAPRALLGALPGATVVDLAYSDRCCGSAGIYNLTQPDMAARLLDQKMDTVEASGADVIAVGNAGCLLQMEWGARQRGSRAAMRHPVDILAEAYPRPGVQA